MATTAPPQPAEPLTPQERARIMDQLDDVFDRAERTREAIDRKKAEGGAAVEGELDVVTHELLADGAHQRVLAVDGLLGVGKSTLCRCLLDHLRAKRPTETHRLVREPVIGELLDMFYADPDDMAERFQIIQCALCLSSARLALIESGHATRPGVVLLDRSPLGNLSFALVHYLAGRISEQGFRAYKAKLASAGLVCLPRTVHLHAPIPAVSQRIQERLQREDPSRACESGVPEAYLRRLDAVMLLVSAYAAARGHSSVRFVDWTHYGSAEAVLDSAMARRGPGPVPTPAAIRAVRTHTELLRMVGLAATPPPKEQEEEGAASDGSSVLEALSTSVAEALEVVS